MNIFKLTMVMLIALFYGFALSQFLNNSYGIGFASFVIGTFMAILLSYAYHDENK